MENEEINSQSLERIAQYLDGEKIVLSPEERLLAAEIDCDQRALAGRLDDVRIPPGVIDRIRRQTRAQALKPVRRLFRVVSWSAAAAAVLVACMFVWQGLHPVATGPGGPIAITPPAGPENPLISMANDAAATESDKVDLISCMTMDNEDLKIAIEKTSPEKAIFGDE
jgi:hypothetical protein